jgi:hypothetical protein
MKRNEFEKFIKEQIISFLNKNIIENKNSFQEYFNDILNEDRCTTIAKRKYKVWPSAYASGAVVKCRKGEIWKKRSKSIKETTKKTDFSKEKESGLHGWFSRRGGGGSKGWVDCNTCRNGKCKSCGRKNGESRAKYPSCRPTPSACKTKGKGISWGKKSKKHKLEELIKEQIILFLNENIKNNTNMKKNKFKDYIKEQIISILNEDTVVVDKNTDPNTVKGKDPNTVKSAINTAKQTGKSVTIAEKENLINDKIKETVKEIKKLTNEYKNAVGSEKTKIVDRLKELNNIKKELENTIR